MSSSAERLSHEGRRLGVQLAARDVVNQDVANTFDREAWKTLAAAGLAGAIIPRQYGGTGLTTAETVAAMAALGETCTDNGLMFALGAHLWACCHPILRFGAESQKRQWLPGLADGSIIGAHAASEPQAGSDATAIKTTARASGDGWILNGTKTFITNAPVADVFLVTAVTEPEHGALGISIFVVPGNADGLTIGSNIEKSGLRTAAMSEVIFDDCRVDADSLLAEAGAGFGIFTITMTHERGLIMAPVVGVLHRLSELSAQFASSRCQFDTPIANFQSVTNRIAEMRLRTETAGLLIQKSAWAADQDGLTAQQAAMTKLHISEAFLATAIDAVRIHGGAGYTTAMELERMVRDAMGALLYSGTSDIQRNLIARAPVRKVAKELIAR